MNITMLVVIILGTQIFLCESEPESGNHDQPREERQPSYGDICLKKQSQNVPHQHNQSTTVKKIKQGEAKFDHDLKCWDYTANDTSPVPHDRFSVVCDATESVCFKRWSTGMYDSTKISRKLKNSRVEKRDIVERGCTTFIQICNEINVRPLTSKGCYDTIPSFFGPQYTQVKTQLCYCHTNYCNGQTRSTMIQLISVVMLWTEIICLYSL